MINMEKILNKFSTDQKELIHILHEIQSEYGYIPQQAFSAISKHLKISESEIFGVLTFYKALSLRPKGKNLITICEGTACHVRGSSKIVEEVEEKLNIKVGQTTPDRKFTVEKVNCLGCCAIGPVVVINGKYYSNMSAKKIDAVLKEY